MDTVQPLKISFWVENWPYFVPQVLCLCEGQNTKWIDFNMNNPEGHSTAR